MKKYLVLLISCLALGLLVSGAVAAQDTNVVTSPQKIVVSVNQEFKIQLNSLVMFPEWKVTEFDPRYVKLVNSTEYITPRPGISFTADRTQIFTFKAIKPGETKITMYNPDFGTKVYDVIILPQIIPLQA